MDHGLFFTHKKLNPEPLDEIRNQGRFFGPRSFRPVHFGLSRFDQFLVFSALIKFICSGLWKKTYGAMDVYYYVYN